MASQAKRSRIVHDALMDVDDDGDFSEKHQVLLAYLLHAKMAKKVDLANVHKKLFNGEETLSESLSSLTAKIDPLKMDIKQVKCDLTGETYYVIIHTAGESYFTRCCIFTKTQLEYLKKVLNGIVLSSGGFIGKIQAINSYQGNKSEGEETLKLFVKERILTEDKGCMSLSPLAVVEFEPYFNSCFSGNLSTCDLCRQLVFIGVPCQGCDQKFHNHCVRTWLNSNRSECPKCSQTWKRSEIFAPFV